MFGSYQKNAYFCNVRMEFLAIRAESREGKTKSTLPILKGATQAALFILGNAS